MVVAAWGPHSVPEDIVFVIDDDPSVRRAVTRLLRSCGRPVESFSSAKDFLNRPLPTTAACLVLDLQMPEISGADLQGLIAHYRDTLPIVFISAHGSIPVSVRAMKGGAIDFLTKPFEDYQLLASIDTALARSRQACRNRDALERDRAVFASLTRRERQVCLRVARGMLNKEIGAELGTTEKTVKVQRGRVMEKLQVRSVTDVVRFVERLQAVGPCRDGFTDAPVQSDSLIGPKSHCA